MAENKETARNTMKSTGVVSAAAIEAGRSELELVRIAIGAQLRWVSNQAEAATHGNLNLNPPRDSSGQITGQTTADLNPYAQQEVLFKELLLKVEAALEAGVSLELEP